MLASPSDLHATRRLIAAHRPNDASEAWSRARMLHLLADPRCFLRERLAGHFTASALITDPALTRLVLVHHRKLDRWLPPGGHPDGDSDLARTALREAMEETGLRSLRLAAPTPYGLDVHAIPARPEAPQHLHHDALFHLLADPDEPLVLSHESLDVAWLEPGDPRAGGSAHLRRVLERLFAA